MKDIQQIEYVTRTEKWAWRVGAAIVFALVCLSTYTGAIQSEEAKKQTELIAMQAKQCGYPLVQRSHHFHAVK